MKGLHASNNHQNNLKLTIFSILQHENPPKFLCLYSELVDCKSRFHFLLGTYIVMTSFYVDVVYSKTCFLGLVCPPNGCVAFGQSFDLMLQILLALSHVKLQPCSSVILFLQINCKLPEASFLFASYRLTTVQVFNKLLMMALKDLLAHLSGVIGNHC